MTFSHAPTCSALRLKTRGLLLCVLLFAFGAGTAHAESGASSTLEPTETKPEPATTLPHFSGPVTAPPAPSPWQLHIDLPLSVVASEPVTGSGTQLGFWGGVRVGAWRDIRWVPAGTLTLGGDLAFNGRGTGQGTADVASAQLLGGLTARALLAYPLEARLIAFNPYLYISGTAQAGFATVRAFNSSHGGGIGHLGVRAGAGLLTAIHWFTMRIELDGGVTGLRPELGLAMSLGLRFRL